MVLVWREGRGNGHEEEERKAHGVACYNKSTYSGSANAQLRQLRQHRPQYATTHSQPSREYTIEMVLFPAMTQKVYSYIRTTRVPRVPPKFYREIPSRALRLESDGTDTVHTYTHRTKSTQYHNCPSYTWATSIRVYGISTGAFEAMQ